jgi:GAF domain-containing protein
MVAALFSEQLRRKAKVYIDKNFFAQKHDYRTQWINFTERLAVCRTSTEVYDEILTTFMRAFGLKSASLYVYSKELGSYVLAACREMRGRPGELCASEALSAYFAGRDRVLNPASGEYVLTKEEAAFFECSGSRLLVPLVGNGRVEALVAFGEQLALEELTYEDYDLMKTLAKHAALSIINFKLSEERAETREIAAVAKVSSFVIHDLKNLASTLSLLLDNAEEYIGDPEFQNDMIGATRNTLSKMNASYRSLGWCPKSRP